MPNLINCVPKYCRHRASGQAYVTIEGRSIYLGTFGKAASKAEYSRVIAEWLAAGRRLPTDPQSVTIAELVAAFRRHASQYYGPKSRAAGNIDESLRPVVKLYARTPAVEFGPLRLKAVRESMIAAGRVRANINRHISNIRGVFKWAAENELKRLTIDVPLGLHKRIKSQCAENGTKMADAVRKLLEKQFPEESASVSIDAAPNSNPA